MDDQHIDHSFVSPVVEEDMAGSSITRPVSASNSEGPTAIAHPAAQSSVPARFPVEDGGRTLAEMAHQDLDAALQLLAERAQYITGASGAAIALRRSEHNDMICRATAGSNAPELGALLSMEYGLSGESVRTRRFLRCDEAERDPRVNREVCRQLGIASVVVMPIVSEQQVFGIFELLSGKPRAFDERDLSALQRLSEMVETAVKHAAAAQTMMVPEPVGVEAQSQTAAIAAVEVEAPIKVEAQAKVESASTVVAPAPPEESALLEISIPPEKDVPAKESIKTEADAQKPEPITKKPVFWSAAMRTPSTPENADSPIESAAVPAMLRNLQKCQACGFPVSHGRAFCVECEERQWRGQRLTRPAATLAQPTPRQPQVSHPAENAPRFSLENDRSSAQTTVPRPELTRDASSVSSARGEVPLTLKSTPIKQVGLDTLASTPSSSNIPGILPLNVPANDPPVDSSALFSNSSLQSESWFASNKYVLGALLVVAIVIATIVWLR